MKSFLIILATIALAVTALPQRQEKNPTPRNADQDTVITRSEFEKNDEIFNWVSELSDGQTHSQSGVLKQVGDEQRVIITGSYSYIAPDGRTIKVDYVADETGFHPVGDHIPQAIQDNTAVGRVAPGAPAWSRPVPSNNRASANRG